jgi:hypothetical protein
MGTPAYLAICVFGGNLFAGLRYGILKYGHVRLPCMAVSIQFFSILPHVHLWSINSRRPTAYRTRAWTSTHTLRKGENVCRLAAGSRGFIPAS